MRVTLSYVDGRVEEFDSDRLTRPDPFPGRSVLSDLVLSLGDDGMWIELDYYDSQGVAEGDALRRRRGWRAQLATAGELAAASRVDVDGTTRWMRVGDGLVDVSRLEDVRASLDDGPSDLPALAAWAYRTGLSIPRWRATTRATRPAGSAPGPACRPRASNSCRACVLPSRQRRTWNPEVRHEAVPLDRRQDHACRPEGAPARTPLGAEAGVSRRALRARPPKPQPHRGRIGQGRFPEGPRGARGVTYACGFPTSPSCPPAPCRRSRAARRPPSRFLPSRRAASRPSSASVPAPPAPRRTCR